MAARDVEFGAAAGADTTCRYCFRPVAGLIQAIPLCRVHLTEFVRHVGGAGQLAGVSGPPILYAADKHFGSQ